MVNMVWPCLLCLSVLLLLLLLLQLARMLKRPFISWVSQRLWAFDSRCSLFMHAAPDLIGTRFR
jgi:hypothetical protein